MKKKSQIRKYTVEKVAQLTKTQTIPEMLKMYAQHVEQKKNKLQDKKASLTAQLNTIRKQTQKIIYQMVDGVKDRLQKNQVVVMTADSRPTKQEVKQLSDLFTYMENQTNLIKKNSGTSNYLHKFIQKIDEDTEHTEADYTQLDETFAKLQAECQRQQIIRDKLLKQRDQKRDFYSAIKQTIAEYRIKYDIVQAQIAQRQKQLDHLVSYFKIRQQEDQQKINKQLNVAHQMEEEILKAQEIFNQMESKKNNLEIKEKQYYSRKSQQL